MSSRKIDLHALLIDDEPQVRSFIAEILCSDGWKVTEASSAEQAHGYINTQEWLLILCDVMLGGDDGYSVLRSFAEQQSEARFVLMTGFGSAAGALDATAIGAYDYLVKPVSIDAILNISKNVQDQYQIRQQQQKISKDTSPIEYVSDIPLIGKSPKFVECLKMVGRVATTALPVLITGESGTGKEVVAKAIHQRSNRKGEFVAVNCSAIPVELIESELFGHAKGAFTGADRERIGLWEEADGGTIFLDEITETSLQFQVKLLRVLQQGEIRRVGSNRTQKVNVRVIAATNRDMEEEVQQGRFRQDLMYRLNAVTIKLPPLRERIEDIPLLADHFAKLALPNSQPMSFSPATVELLKNYNWQGNIRELENATLHAVSMAEDIIYPEHLPAAIKEHSRGASQTTLSESLSENTEQWITLAEAEAIYVEKVLAYTGGNKQASSRILNIDRKTLNRIIQRNKTETNSEN